VITARPAGRGKARESRDGGRWRRGDPPPRLSGCRHDARQAVPDVPNQGNRRGRPTPVMHTTHATASWRRGEKGSQQTLVAPFRDEHRTRPLTNLLPELGPALLPESWPLTNLLPTSYLSLLPEGYPLIRLLPGTLTQRGLFLEACALLLPTSYLGTWPLTTLLPGTWPLTDLLPGPLT